MFLSQQASALLIAVQTFFGENCLIENSKEIAKFAEVQEVHIITGDWDLLIKVKAENVEAIGKFVIDKLRLVKGIEKTLTCVVFETEKETTEIPL